MAKNQVNSYTNRDRNVIKKKMLDKQICLYFIFMIAAVLSSAYVSCGQNAGSIICSQRDNESFLCLTDSVLQNEIATFNYKRSAFDKKNMSKIKLTEISLKSCDEKSVLLSKSDIWGWDDVYVLIYSSKFDSAGHKLTHISNSRAALSLIDNKPFWGTGGSVPKRKVDSIFCEVRSRFQIKFPDSAFIGIYEPNVCNYDKKNKKEKLTSPYYKAFISEDRRRLYIYLVSGIEANSYEVTWVIKNGKYYTRVIDSL